MFPWSSATDKSERAAEKLFDAIESGDAAKVRALLRKGKVDANTPSDKFGRNPLHAACFKGHVQVMEALLKANADAMATTKDGRTSLHWASIYGHIQAVELLLTANADPKATDMFGKTPLHYACSGGHITVVQLLLKANADHITADEDGRTPFHYASSEDHVPVVELLLKTNADPNATDKNGRTLLHYASTGGHVSVVELLLKANVDHTKTDEDGKPPLHYASSGGHVPVVQLLLKANADPNAAAENGQTPLHAACGYHKSETARVLLAGGANIHSADKRGLKPMHACIEHDVVPKFSNETLRTLQVLVSSGATWDATCDEMVASGRATQETPALHRCILLWAEEHADGLEFSDILLEVIKRGTESTQMFINALKTSHKIVLRRKICVVGSSFAGKTSFVKSITTESLKPQLEHVDDRTIGIDHFPLRFEQSIISRGDIKIHEVTFWDFAGQNAYQVAHSLFFSPRTLFLVVVDLHAFAIAYMQAVIFANEEYQEAELLGEFVEQSISHWIRLILARQPDAEFVFIATKDDVLKENTVTEMLLKDELMQKLRGVGGVVEQMKEAATKHKGKQADLNFAPVSHNTTAGVAAKELPIHFVSCTSRASIEMARAKVEELIMRSERSVPMPDTYTQALDDILEIRQEAKALDISDRMGRIIVPVSTLPAELKIEPGVCNIIMQTLHDLGDVLWYEDLDVEFFQKSVILDPMLLIDFIRQVITHKHTGQILSHTDLKAKPLWRGLVGNRALMEAMKKLLQFFHLVYSASEDRVMRWDSHLIVPAFWQTKTPASWKFLGDVLRLEALKNVVDGERVRVRWEYHFAYGLPLALFDHVVVATVSSFLSFDAGPDWILCEGREGFTACRLMVSRDLRSLLQTVEVEAVVAKAASEREASEFWKIFQYLVGAFIGILRECPGLVVSAYDEDGRELDLNDLLRSTTPLVDLSTSWMPPPETWKTFRLPPSS